jgi:hypothetical protein
MSPHDLKIAAVVSFGASAATAFCATAFARIKQKEPVIKTNN